MTKLIKTIVWNIFPWRRLKARFNIAFRNRKQYYSSNRSREKLGQYELFWMDLFPAHHPHDALMVIVKSIQSIDIPSLSLSSSLCLPSPDFAFNVQYLLTLLFYHRSIGKLAHLIVNRRWSEKAGYIMWECTGCALCDQPKLDSWGRVSKSNLNTDLTEDKTFIRLVVVSSE